MPKWLKDLSGRTTLPADAMLSSATAIDGDVDFEDEDRDDDDDRDEDDADVDDVVLASSALAALTAAKRSARAAFAAAARFFCEISPGVVAE